MSHSELLRVFSGLESSMLNASAKKPARGLSLFADQVMLCSDAEYPISQSPDVVEKDVFISSITLFCRLREPMVSCSLFPAVLMEEIYASEMISPESSSWRKIPVWSVYIRLMMLSLDWGAITRSGVEVSVMVYTKWSSSLSNFFFMLSLDLSNFFVKLSTSLSSITTTAVAEPGVYPLSTLQSKDTSWNRLPELFSVASRLPMVSTGFG